MARDGRGWRKEPVRHGLAAKGIKTGNKSYLESTKSESRTMAEMDKKNLMFWAGKDRTYYLRKYPHPGKFEGGAAIDPYVYEVTLEDSEVVGDVEYGAASAYTMMGPDALDRIVELAKEDGEKLTKDEREFISDMAGVIATEDNFGFVDIEYFETKKEFDQAIVNLEDQWEKFYREELPEDDGGY